MSWHPDILIVGGGVIGLTTAYYLVRQGASVRLLDQGDLGRQASWAGAGIIPPGDSERAQTPYDRLRAFSSGLFPGLSADLREQTGIDNGYLVCGGVELPEPGSPIATDQWLLEGIEFEKLDRSGLKRVVPELTPSPQEGYYLPAMAQLRNPRYLKALIQFCQQTGVDLKPGVTARSFVLDGSRILGVETNQGRQTAGSVLLATGAWTDPLLLQVGFQPGIHPVRGQIALLRTNRTGVFPILLQGKRYVVRRNDGLVLVGSTEENAGFDAVPTATAIASLVEFSRHLMPGLGEPPIERSWAGLRPGSIDGLPYLGVVPGYDGLFVAAGHFRAGIQLSPATGLLMSELLARKPTSIAIDDFRLDRPPALKTESAFRS